MYPIPFYYLCLKLLGKKSYTSSIGQDTIGRRGKKICNLPDACNLLGKIPVEARREVPRTEGEAAGDNGIGRWRVDGRADGEMKYKGDCAVESGGGGLGTLACPVSGWKTSVLVIGEITDGSGAIFAIINGGCEGVILGKMILHKRRS
jgi:hypothetical protein